MTSKKNACYYNNMPGGIQSEIQSKQKGNGQELIQSNAPLKTYQKGKKHKHILINFHE